MFKYLKLFLKHLGEFHTSSNWQDQSFRLGLSVPTRLGLNLSEAKVECQLPSDPSTKGTCFSMRCAADLSLLRKWYMMRRKKEESVFSCLGKYPRMKRLFLIFKTNTVFFKIP